MAKELRILEAQYDDGEVVFSVAFLITSDKDIFHSHPYMMKLMQESYPNLHPRKITWSTHEPDNYNPNTP